MHVRDVTPSTPSVWSANAPARLSSDTISRPQESIVLFHVSEETGIVEFVPRPSKYSRTSAADAERFLGRSTSDTFECLDECAGYFVSREPVRPLQVEVIEDPIAALLGRGVELRILPTLSPLRDSIVASTLQFSIIRMRNADAVGTATNVEHG